MRKVLLSGFLSLTIGGLAAAQQVTPRAIPFTMLGAPNGVATLSGGKVPASQLNFGTATGSVADGGVLATTQATANSAAVAAAAAAAAPLNVTLRAPISTDDSTKGYLVGDDWNTPASASIFTNVQNAPGFAVWQAASIAAPYPVDGIGGTIPAACYGTKLLRAAYTGALINVENPTAQVPTDIGFMPDGSINAKALWAVAGSAGYVYVDGWYDQCGSTTGANNASNPNEATQATLANMPTMTPPGTLGNSFPVIFDGQINATQVSKFLTLPASVAFATGVPISAVVVGQQREVEADAELVGLTDTTNSGLPFSFGNFQATGAFGEALSSNALSNTVALPDTPFVAGAVANGNTPASFVWLDGRSFTGSTVRGSLALAGGTIGKFVQDTNGAFAEESELLLYNRALSTTDEATANAVNYRYFGITPQVDTCWIANGDSITQGYLTTLDQNYVAQTKLLLSHPMRVFNASVFGQTSSQQTTYLLNNMVTKFGNCLGAPNKVLSVFDGTNDIATPGNITAAQAGNVLTTTTVGANFGPDTVITGTGVPAGETVVNQLTGTFDQAGTYTVSASVGTPIASESMVASTTPASIYYNDQLLAALAHANGMKFVLYTMLPRGGFTTTNNGNGVNEDSIRLAYDTLVTSNSGGFEDSYVDVASDPTMGNSSNVTNTTDFADNTHPSNFGDAFLAQPTATTLNKLFP